MVIATIKNYIDGQEPLVLSKDGKTVYFRAKELRCSATKKYRFAAGFLDALRDLREELGESISVNSCCRSKAYNDTLGESSPRSFHIYDKPYYPTFGTCAIDIARRNKVYDDKLIRLALKKGWYVGLSNSFIHLDRRVDHVPAFKKTAIARRTFVYAGYTGNRNYA